MADELPIGLQRCTFVVFSDDWGRHPSSCQHLFRRVLGKADVVWVNTVGLRTPRLSLYDARRAAEVLGKWAGDALKRRHAGSPRSAPSVPSPDSPGRAVGSEGKCILDANNVEPRVIRPFMLPFYQFPWVRALNDRWIKAKVEQALEHARPERILVSTVPIIPGLFRSPLFQKHVYYCVDDFTAWPGVDGSIMRNLEEQLLATKPRLFAVSDALLESRGTRCRDPKLLTHGVDVKHFAQANRLQPHPRLGSPKGPVVGLFGVFDERVDADLLRKACEALPEASFVVLGPVDRSLAPFEGLSNLHFYGSVPYSQLPAYVAGFSVLILPYVIDDTTKHINPLKLKEYLATGKPVVTTPLLEALKLKAHMQVAEREAFVEALHGALYEWRPSQDVDVYLERESWESKAAQFFGALVGTG